MLKGKRAEITRISGKVMSIAGLCFVTQPQKRAVKHADSPARRVDSSSVSIFACKENI